MFLFKHQPDTPHRQAIASRVFIGHRSRSGAACVVGKNREDCTPTEAQIQYVAKILDVRPATVEELEKHFPGVRAGERFQVIVELYWLEPLDTPFNLSQAIGPAHKYYNTVQDFSKLKDEDELAVFGFLVKKNPRVVISYLNRSDLPEKLAEREFDLDAG
jgi:hypothetical protein